MCFFIAIGCRVFMIATTKCRCCYIFSYRPLYGSYFGFNIYATAVLGFWSYDSNCRGEMLPYQQRCFTQSYLVDIWIYIYIFNNHTN